MITEFGNVVGMILTKLHPYQSDPSIRYLYTLTDDAAWMCAVTYSIYLSSQMSAVHIRHLFILADDTVWMRAVIYSNLLIITDVRCSYKVFMYPHRLYSLDVRCSHTAFIYPHWSYSLDVRWTQMCAVYIRYLSVLTDHTAWTGHIQHLYTVIPTEYAVCKKTVSPHPLR